MKNLNEHIKNSCQRIAPAWPLKNMVAVNPYMGFFDSKFEDASITLLDRGNVRTTMPLSYYLNFIKENAIEKQDILKAHKYLGKSLESYPEFIKNVERFAKREQFFQWQGSCLIDIAGEVSGKNWSDFMIESLSQWTATFLDEGVALWNSEDPSKEIYAAWKKHAEVDLSPEIMGLKDFRKTIKALPENAQDLIRLFLEQLKIEEDNSEDYLHALLLKTVGWSSFIAGLDFNNQVYSDKTDKLSSYLAILIAWEAYFFKSYDSQIRSRWFEQMHDRHQTNRLMLSAAELAILLQEAFDLSTQRKLIQDFKKHNLVKTKSNRKAQMVFCIDVRSEVFRRNLELTDDEIETIGFAGFFGFPIAYKPVGHEIANNQCPVLIPSTVNVTDTFSNSSKAAKTKESAIQVAKIWKQFKSGAVTSFGFVSPLGLGFLPKLISDSNGWTRPVKGSKSYKSSQQLGWSLDLSTISLEEKTTMAIGALTGMGIKNDLAPFVLITGHGSSSVNNPHASGLDCGACGGHSGEVNALTAQLILNDKEVRAELHKQGIDVPNSTLFVACLHDTTTDKISIVNENSIPNSQKAELNKIFESIEIASERTRVERSNRFNFKTNQKSKIKNAFLRRTNDWSQIRPEWGLAGCNAFVIADRSKTQGLDLNGRAFLHNYNWANDQEFTLLEAIMTAPMVVTSWINLQYYASVTDNNKFGAGDKTLHNVTSGSGVIEGSSGDLRIGLPLQSVHNGKTFEHQPQRLNVIIDAPIEAINSILLKHDNLKQLFDNSWIFLHRMDEEGNISHTFRKELNWENTTSEVIPSIKKVITS